MHARVAVAGASGDVELRVNWTTYFFTVLLEYIKKHMPVSDFGKPSSANSTPR